MRTHPSFGLGLCWRRAAVALQPVTAQEAKLNIIAFGAHPDDCDIRAGGTAAKWAAAGHNVRFVAVTNGDAGHQTKAAARWRRGGAPRRRKPASASASSTSCSTTTTAS